MHFPLDGARGRVRARLDKKRGVWLRFSLKRAGFFDIATVYEYLIPNRWYPPAGAAGG